MLALSPCRRKKTGRNRTSRITLLTLYRQNYRESCCIVILLVFPLFLSLISAAPFFHIFGIGESITHPRRFGKSFLQNITQPSVAPDSPGVFRQAAHPQADSDKALQPAGNPAAALCVKTPKYRFSFSARGSLLLQSSRFLRRKNGRRLLLRQVGHPAQLALDLAGTHPYKLIQLAAGLLQPGLRHS